MILMIILHYVTADDMIIDNYFEDSCIALL